MGNKKSTLKKPGPERKRYVVVLPNYTKAWDLVYCGDIDPWLHVADRYGFADYAYCCNDVNCDREFICFQYVRAICNQSKHTFIIDRFRGIRMFIPFLLNADVRSLVDKGFKLNTAAATLRDNLILLVMHQEDCFLSHLAFLLIDYKCNSIVSVLLVPNDNITVIQCDISPDKTVTTILFFSNWCGEFSYNLYIFSNETGNVNGFITLNQEVQPCIAFDPRSGHSTIAIANYESKDENIAHELVIYSLDTQNVIQRSNLPLRIINSSQFNLLYSKDGRYLILQKLTDNRFGITAYCDMYFFLVDKLHLVKYFTTMLPGLFRVCRVNYEPVFSRCGSFMRLLDHKTNGHIETVTVQIYQLPLDLGLQSQCRRIILRQMSATDDIKCLPLPQKLKNFLLFLPGF